MLIVLLILAMILSLVLAAVVALCSLKDHLLRAEQGSAFLRPTVLTTHDGTSCVVPAGLLQVSCLAREYHPCYSSDEEELL